MKATINKKDLLSALYATEECKTNRTTLPIYNHVKIEVTQDRASFTATDLEVAMTYLAVVTTEETGVCTVSHKGLLDLVKRLTDDIVTIAYDGSTLRVEAGSKKGTLEGEDVTDGSEYDLSTTTAGGDALEVNTALFASMIRRVVVAAASDDSRPVLTGVCIEWDADVLTLAAADAFCLVKDSVELPGSWEACENAIVPARSMKIVAKRLKGDSITIERNNSQVSFRSGNMLIRSRLIQGRYPNFRCIIPKDEDTKTSAIVRRKTLIKAICSMAPIAKESSEITRFHVQIKDEMQEIPNCLLVQADHEDTELKVRTLAQVEAITDGEAQEIVLNNSYAKTLLSGLDTEFVQLQFQSPKKPAKFTTATLSGYIAVLMPMHINR